MSKSTNLKNALKSILIGTCLFGTNLDLAHEHKITKGYHTMDAMGCMIMKDCTNGVDKIYSSGDLRAEYPDSDWDGEEVQEFDQIMVAFNQIELTFI